MSRPVIHAKERVLSENEARIRLLLNIRLDFPRLEPLVVLDLDLVLRESAFALRQ